MASGLLKGEICSDWLLKIWEGHRIHFDALIHLLMFVMCDVSQYLLDHLVSYPGECGEYAS